MSDPSIAFILIPSFLLALTGAYYFKTLDTRLWREARVPLAAGLVSGFVIRLAGTSAGGRFAATGVALTLAALYVRLTGRESEPSDGMVLGAMTGAAAAVPFVVTGDDGLMRFAECALAGAVAGYGITFGIAHTRNRSRQFGFDLVTAMFAIGAAWLPTRAIGPGWGDRHVAIAAATLIPLVVVSTVFKQWPVIREEVSGEAALGVIDAADVGATAHPFRRLGRAGWHSPGAHREFVRIATRLALRRRQQRRHVEEVARLYQLEVIKLRMELQEMTRIDREMRLRAAKTESPGEG